MHTDSIPSFRDHAIAAHEAYLRRQNDENERRDAQTRDAVLPHANATSRLLGIPYFRTWKSISGGPAAFFDLDNLFLAQSATGLYLLEQCFLCHTYFPACTLAALTRDLILEQIGEHLATNTLYPKGLCYACEKAAPKPPTDPHGIARHVKATVDAMMPDIISAVRDAMLDDAYDH